MTRVMLEIVKIAISVPDALFEAGEEAAQRRGISRSRPCAEALKACLLDLSDDEITARLDRACGLESSALDPVIARVQGLSRPQDDWQMQRGETWWALLPEPVAPEPGSRRPLRIVKADAFNRSRIRTIVGVTSTTNLTLADAPGNVLAGADEAGLPRDSVIDVSKIVTADRAFPTEQVGHVGGDIMVRVEDGLRRAPAL